MKIYNFEDLTNKRRALKKHLQAKYQRSYDNKLESLNLKSKKVIEKQNEIIDELLGHLKEEQTARIKYWQFCELLLDAITLNDLENVVIAFLDEEAKIEEEHGYPQYSEEIFSELKQEIRTRWDFLKEDSTQRRF